ncbi:galactose mutarotase-like domain-containing protein [Cokeromyces recurvatus]|uniref:galactose mutarotase-like domain-containing protein n=1 Tax=Cokeromyces recurvatus TaxID=90255 RepID=UPI002220443D|nr:galactose mutarotase-like domain-containing protein [Cokeromyces recurvatus]KAI7906375.1 galactose mutarotase-like domain-containing protein [Cokeromyces recurvatus]
MTIYGHRHSHHADNSLRPSLDNAPRVPKNITQSRVNNFLASGGQFYGMGIQTKFWLARQGGPPYVNLKVYSVPDLKRIPFKEAVTQKFQDFNIGVDHSFGPSWSTHWFHISILIPKEMDSKEVILQWDMGCEGLVWSTDGVPLQGLTGGTDQARHEFIISKYAKSEEKYEFYIEAACNGMFGVGANDAMVADPDRYFNLTTADLVVPNKAIQALYHDLIVIRGIAYDTDQNSSRSRQALWTLNEVINNYIGDDEKAIEDCLQLTHTFLCAQNGTGTSQHQITAVGNCHIDTAWLWPYDETKRKIARSWSSQLMLMDSYPHYVFTGSQVQQYEWLKELYPVLFERIQKAEKTGQWEIIGGSWVEHGTNMPSGESLCRQMLLGQQFYEKNFGKRTRVFWLPDSFGYSAQLPQILKSSGCDYFFTQKLSWNNINKFPLSTFWWTGIDDSRILAHLTPAETYTASVTPSELYKCSRNHHDLEYSNESLLVYGHGDGGGGPTPEMLERLKRMHNVDGLPIVKPGSATEFFISLEKNSNRLQSYKGELYLEFHRGTYTSQALVKKGNRKSEVIIRDVEILATIAKVLSNKINSDYSYPVKQITHLWKLICLNQFHDCLPGSAINLAYVDVHKFHREVISSCSLLRYASQSFIIDESTKECFSSTKENSQDHQSIIAFNTLPWSRTEVIISPEKNTKWMNQQWKENYEYLIVKNVPGLGASNYVASAENFHIVPPEKAAQAYKTEHNHFVLENMNLKATFNPNGQLIELIDKNSTRGNLISKDSRGNILQLYEDVPTYWDAWDIEIYHLQKYVELESQNTLKIISDGPLKAELYFNHKISDISHIEQTISLTCVSERLEFESFVDWHESHQCLKVEFNWDIVTDYATYDIQYGVVRRPTHYNTTIESAKFEVCGHKFADLSESNYGIALINDCKYGYSTHGNTQRLSLLRSPKGPDETADMGQHKFKYAIYPHQGCYASSRVMQSALEFNVPLSIRLAKGHTLQRGTLVPSLFTIEPNNQIIIDTIKFSEDDNGEGKQIILRIYEAYGGKSSAVLKSYLDIKRIQISNVLEDNLGQVLKKENNGYNITLKAFQIMTLKVDLN